MDLSNLSSPQLRDLLQRIDNQLAAKILADRSDARARIMKIADAAGLSIESLIKGSLKLSDIKRSVAVKYRHPENEALQWTGRGRQPKWVKEWTDSGKTIDGLRI